MPERSRTLGSCSLFPVPPPPSPVNPFALLLTSVGEITSYCLALPPLPYCPVLPPLAVRAGLKPFPTGVPCPLLPWLEGALLPPPPPPPPPPPRRCLAASWAVMGCDALAPPVDSTDWRRCKRTEEDR